MNVFLVPTSNVVVANNEQRTRRKNRRIQLGKIFALLLLEYAIFYEAVNFRREFIFEFSCFPAPEKLSGLTAVALSILSTSLQTMRSYVDSKQGE